MEKKIVVNEAALDSAVSSLQYPKASLEGAGMQGKDRGAEGTVRKQIGGLLEV